MNPRRQSTLLRSIAVLLLTLLAIGQPAPIAARQPTFARHAMVVAEEPLASDVGLAVLKSGGNAVDAAVAVGFALAVTHPFAGNLGGGGFMLIRLADGRSTFIDFRETAPARATHDMYLDSSGQPTRDSLKGWRASGVPGTVRGLELAHRKYGSKPWASLVHPAVELAERGFPISKSQMDSWRHDADYLGSFPETKRIFLKDSKFYDWNENFRQPELARTLERIERKGSQDFYEGATAHMLADAMAKNGGLITLEDLRNYKAVERTPLEGDYHGYHIITSPPPSSGGVGILQMLAVLNGTGYEKTGAGSAEAYHYMAAAMQRYYADRNEYLGDPDFVKNPIMAMLDPAYIAKRRATIDPAHATPADQISPGAPDGREGANTTHYDVVDEQGNAVAVTYTLNDGYGSGVTVPGAGFLLNDEMDDFAAKPGTPNLFGLVQGEKNSIAPGKRPLSSMVPTMLLKDGNPFLILGAPGGPRIITAVLQVILNIVDFHMNVQDAVDFPRIHDQWKPDWLETERRVSPDTIAALERMGYRVSEMPPWDSAEVGAILIDNGWVQGAPDGRRAEAKAVGY